MSNCNVIAIANQKGGVGKTTTTFNLGVALSKLGKKVLLLDTDPQGDLTTYMGYYETNNIPTIASVMESEILNNKYNIKEAVLHHKENIDLIPANLDLSSIAVSLVNVENREKILRNCIKDIKNDYDYILIDCMPSLEMITVNALSCADKVIIPVQTHYLAAKGMGQLLGSISTVKRKINPNLGIEGILLTIVDRRTTLSNEIKLALQENYGSVIKVFNTQIPQAIKATRSTSEGKSIFAFDNKNIVAEAYLQLAQEVITNGKERKQNAPTKVR